MVMRTGKRQRAPQFCDKKGGVLWVRAEDAGWDARSSYERALTCDAQEA